jgi:hypothetical protein
MIELLQRIKDKFVQEKWHWHFICSALLAVGFMYLTYDLVQTCLYTMLVGVGKELYDKFTGYKFSYSDLIADILGMGFGLFVLFLIAYNSMEG